MEKKIIPSVVASLLLATNVYSNTDKLSQITVYSATKSEQSIKDVTSNVEVITKEQIEERQFTTVTEALNTVPGVSFTSNGGLGKTTSVRLRGFDSKRALVLIDGIRYNDLTSSAGAPFENIMINDIERIEVIKGAQSGIWGADASAGVINIITSKSKLGFNGQVNLEYGSFNTKKSGINLSYATNNYYIKGFYNKLDTNGFSAHSVYGEDLDKYEDDAYENETYGVKTGFNFDDSNKIDFSHTISKSENEFDNFGSDSLTNASSGKNKLSSISFENISSLATTNIYFNRSDFYRDYPPYASEYDGKVDEFGVKTNIDYLNDTSFLVVGADYKKFKQDDIINNDYKNKAIYVTNSNKIDNTVFTQSLRYDKYDSFDNKTTGKIGIKHNFTKDIFLSSNYGTAYNIPKLSELYGAFGANPNLKPETTKSFDLNFGFYDFTATYFDNKITNMIDWNGAGYNNLDGKSKIKGFEINYQKQIVSDLLLSLGYTRLSAKNNDDQTLARRAKQTLKMQMDYYGIKNFHFNLNGEYVGKRYNSANETGTQTGKYTVWNSVVNYSLNKDLSFYLKVDNIFDKYYQTVSTYSTAPRSAYLGLSYKF